MTASGRTRLVFLVGDPVEHAKGFSEYADMMAALRLDAAYLPVHVPAGRLAPFLGGMRHARNLAGIVVTIPHKGEAFALGTPDAAARRARAANLLRPAGEEGWECSNVDGIGFLIAATAAGMTVPGRRVQLLGAGGAGRAVAMSLADRGPAHLAVHDPDAARAAALVADLRRAFPHLPAGAELGPSEFLINASSVGMGDDAALPLPDDLIPAGGDVYDIVNRRDTPLLRAAHARGCRVDHGRSMMLAQIPLVLRWFFRR